MADATGTLPGNRHDDPSSLRPAKILGCSLDYRTGGSLLESRPGSILKSAEDSDRIDYRPTEIERLNALRVEVIDRTICDAMDGSVPRR